MQIKITKILPEKIDAALIINPENRRYLSGFSGSNCTLILTRGLNYLITDSRYSEQVKNQTKNYEIIIQDRDSEKIEDIIYQVLMKHSVKKLGFEAAYMTVDMYNKFLEKFTRIEMIPNDGYIENMRSIKIKNEIEQIREACRITDKAFSEILKKIRIGMSELEAAVELDYIIGKLGAGRAFNILLSGANSSMPHGIPSEKKIMKGDFVLMDFGVTVDGCHSDMTRTIVMGEASNKQKEVYNLVLLSQATGIKTIKAGLKTNVPHNKCRDTILNSPYSKYVFDHGVGHGIGLFVHEDPFLRVNSDEYLKSGNILTIEPGIYIPGFGGVRIEDDILVTDNGYEVLTKSPKELLILK